MPEKLTDNEKKRLNDLQDQIYDLTFEYGRQDFYIETLEDELEKERGKKEEILQNLREVKSEHDDFMREIYKKYGDVGVDPKSGEILSPEEMGR